MSNTSRSSILAFVVALTACDRVGRSDNDGETPPATAAAAAQVAPAPTAAVAAGNSSAVATGAVPPTVEPGGIANLAAAAGTETAAGRGKFVWKFVPAKHEIHRRYEALFQHPRLSSLVEVMGSIALPRMVPVATLECGQPNAFYTEAKHGVVLCYELAHEFYTKFLANGADDQTASDKTLNALTFVMLHEMGHGVIGELGLGVTGGEEDAVDDLAALLLVDAKQPAWAIDGALSMALLGAGSKPSYFDEHSLGEQRFYNITCIVLGSDPEKHSGLVTEGVVPQHRAVRCPKEYQQKNKAWEDLLEPHLHTK